MTRPTDFRFRHRLRVRWVEVDAQQVVFNGHYLTYLDVAISDYWRSAGMPYPDAFHFLRGDIFVRRNMLEYHAPAKLDDWLDIGLRCDRIGTSSLTMAWAIWSQGRLLVTGEVVYVFTALGSGKSTAVPEALRQQLLGYEEGKAVHALRCGPWHAQAEDARSVRLAVFVAEQGIPEEEEWDADDASAVHAVVRNLTGCPLATGRLIHDGLEAGHAKIGRMAVLRSARGIGLGDQVLAALLEEARQRGLHHIGLHAQVSALNFYARHGFVPRGDVFDEVEIPHQLMTLTLSPA
jgi:YbgC/YbaW family acyl-CoA thioester hydrolase